MTEKTEQEKIDALWTQLDLHTQHDREVFCVQLIAQRLTGHMAVVYALEEGFQVSLECECLGHYKELETFKEWYIERYPQVYQSKLEALTMLIVVYRQYEAQKAWPEVVVDGKAGGQGDAGAVVLRGR